MMKMTNKKRIIIIIPVRLNSKRVQNKPLRNIKGKTIIRRCFECCFNTGYKTYIAADEKIGSSLGANSYTSSLWSHRLYNSKLVEYDPVIWTEGFFKNGTERVFHTAKALGLKDDDIVINVQGDHSYIDPEIIKEIIEVKLESSEKEVVTSFYEIQDNSQLYNENRVKVLYDKDGYAMLFVRNMDKCIIPDMNLSLGIHIGIYAYSFSFLKKYCETRINELEDTLKLEQIRIWDADGLIKVIKSLAVPVVIDSEEDLRMANEKL